MTKRDRNEDPSISSQCKRSKADSLTKSFQRHDSKTNTNGNPDKCIYTKKRKQSDEDTISCLPYKRSNINELLSFFHHLDVTEKVAEINRVQKKNSAEEDNNQSDEDNNQSDEDSDQYNFDQEIRDKNFQECLEKLPCPTEQFYDRRFNLSPLLFKNYLISTISKLRKRHPNVQFTLASDNKLENCRNLTKLLKTYPLDI